MSSIEFTELRETDSIFFCPKIQIEEFLIYLHFFTHHKHNNGNNGTLTLIIKKKEIILKFTK